MDYVKQILINYKDELEEILANLKGSQNKADKEIAYYSKRIKEVETSLEEVEKIMSNND